MGGSVALPSGQNQISTIRDFVSGNGLTLFDFLSLQQTGVLIDPVRIALTVDSPLTLTGTVNAPAVNLVVNGALTQTGGAISNRNPDRQRPGRRL